MRTTVIGFALALGSTLTIGCAGARPNLAESGALRVERPDTPKASVTQAYLYRDEGGGLLVSGKVKRDTGHAMALGGHVDVAVYGPEGRMLEQVSVSYLPGDLQQFKSQRRMGASFSARFPTMPPQGSTIRVAFHETRSLSELKGFDCGENTTSKGGLKG